MPGQEKEMPGVGPEKRDARQEKINARTREKKCQDKRYRRCQDKRKEIPEPEISIARARYKT